MTYEDAINIYTDGSSYSNPRRGGLGIRIIVYDDNGDEVIEDYPSQGHKGATNNSMELLACIEGIKLAQCHSYHSRVKRIVIFSDSMYVVNNYTNAIFQWPKQHWRNKNGRPIENAQLWKEFVKLYKSESKRIELKWVKGHAKNIHNKAVDKQAKNSAKGFLKSELKIQKIRRKKTDTKTIIGSIVPEGQRISLYIVGDEYFPIQKCYKYRCQVISKNSKYYDNVDFLFSDLLLNAGHQYYVQLNKNTGNPMIIKVFRELI